MFADRIDAGKELAKLLKKYKLENPLVVALPRGGVAVGFPVARALRSPLEIEIVRKLGAPQNLEFGIGAIAEDDIVYLDHDMLEYFRISDSTLRLIKEREKRELERRKKLYRGGKSLGLLTNRTVILVDDGLATGVTAQAAILSVKKHHPKKIIFAAPVCAKETADQIRSMVDSIVCAAYPEKLDAIGRYYDDFRQMTDEDVLTYLQRINGQSSIPSSVQSDFSHKIVW
jgi:putative phosphoribosyl transferase